MTTLRVNGPRFSICHTLHCYAYAFGNLLVLALYRQYQELGQAFVPGYLVHSDLWRVGKP